MRIKQKDYYLENNFPKQLNMKNLLFITSAFLIFSCNSPSEKNQTTSSDELETPYLNYMDTTGVIYYHLRESEYVIKMQISGLQKTVIEDAFSIKADAYSVPVKKKGYLLDINFVIKNPYDKELIIPIPSYFALTTENDSTFANKTIFSKSCMCNIINTTDITGINGKKLYEISDENCGVERNCVKFNPEDVKEFTIHFSEPILESEKDIILIGFELYWNDSNYLYRKDKGIVIDTENKLIKGLKEL